VSSNLQAVVDATNAAGGSKVVYGASGWVKKFNQDEGLAREASTLERGKTSGVIKSTKGDSYYFVRLLDSNDTQVSYEYIQIPLTAFANELDNLDKTGKIIRYISVPKMTNTQ